MAENSYDFAESAEPVRVTSPRRRRLVLVLVLLMLSGGLWVSNWLYQRSVLLERAFVTLDEPVLPWGNLIGDEKAREWFGEPTSLSILQDDVTPYQAKLIGGYIFLNSLTLRDMNNAEVSELDGLTNLRSLRLLNSPISDDACRVIGQLDTLNTLEINCHTEDPVKITDAGMAHLANLKNLKSLVLQVPSVTDEGLKYLAELPVLTHLTIQEAQIHGDGLKEFARLNDPENMYLENCSLKGDCLRHLTGCQRLRTISFRDCNLTDEMLEDLIPMSSVRGLVLTGTEVTTEGCRQFHEARPDVLLTDANGDRVGEPVSGDLGGFGTTGGGSGTAIGKAAEDFGSWEEFERSSNTTAGKGREPQP